MVAPTDRGQEVHDFEEEPDVETVRIWLATGKAEAVAIIAGVGESLVAELKQWIMGGGKRFDIGTLKESEALPARKCRVFGRRSS